MPESIIRSEKDHNEETIENNESPANPAGEKLEGVISTTRPLIIWTPDVYYSVRATSSAWIERGWPAYRGMGKWILPWRMD